MRIKNKQLKLTVTYIVLICVFVGAGLYFHKRPLFNKQGLTINAKEEPVSTYAPYAAAELAAADPDANAPVEPVAAVRRFFTSARASVFTFSGLKSEKELQSVLDALKKTGSRATFFVTAEEMAQLPDQIEAIRLAGHSLGISVRPAEKTSAEQLLGVLQTQAQALREKYGADYEIFIRPAFGTGSAELLQAAASGGFRVISETKEAVPESASRMTDAADVMAEIFGPNERALQRGQIVHFQMGLFQYSDTVLGELVERVIADKCVYPILPVDALARDTEHLYAYPVAKEQIPDAVRDKIYPGHLAGKTPEEISQIIHDGYIGSDWVNQPLFFPGFSDEEAWKLDTTGLVENDENYVFLTFDDWGSDRIVDELLTVLEKHNAIGTFFVRSNFVPSNPNLLRAIAAGGHTIGAHSHTHMPLSNEPEPHNYQELDEAQRAALEKDIVLCYETLESVVGDMTDKDGKPSLSLLFRQPTLAVGKNGLQTVFDCGYTYAVAGSYSPDDYVAENAEALAEEMLANVKSGAILVLHFLDSAKNTPEAVDLTLTALENSGADYKFVGLNKVLG